MRKIVVASVVWFLMLPFLAGCAQDRGSRKSQAQAKQTIGRAYLAEGDRQSALKALLEAAELDPEDETLQDDIGIAYAEFGQFDKAEFHLKKALSIKSNYSDAMNHLGMIYAREGKNDLAIELFTKAAEDLMYPSRFAAYNNLGLVYFFQGQHEKALDGFRKATEAFPEYSLGYDNMGMSYEALRQWDRAVESYKNSIRFAPDNPKSYLHLASLYLKFNRREEARELILKAMDVDKSGEFKTEAKTLLDQSEKRG